MNSSDSDYEAPVELAPRPSKASRNLLLTGGNDSEIELTKCVNSDDRLIKDDNMEACNLTKKSSSLIMPLDVEHVNAHHHHDDPHYPHLNEDHHGYHDQEQETQSHTEDADTIHSPQCSSQAELSLGEESTGKSKSDHHSLADIHSLADQSSQLGDNSLLEDISMSEPPSLLQNGDHSENFSQSDNVSEKDSSVGNHSAVENHSPFENHSPIEDNSRSEEGSVEELDLSCSSYGLASPPSDMSSADPTMLRTLRPGAATVTTHNVHKPVSPHMDILFKNTADHSSDPDLTYLSKQMLTSGVTETQHDSTPNITSKRTDKDTAKTIPERSGTMDSAYGSSTQDNYECHEQDIDEWKTRLDAHLTLNCSATLSGTSVTSDHTDSASSLAAPSSMEEVGESGCMSPLFAPSLEAGHMQGLLQKAAQDAQSAREEQTDAATMADTEDVPSPIGAFRMMEQKLSMMSTDDSGHSDLDNTGKGIGCRAMNSVLVLQKRRQSAGNGRSASVCNSCGSTLGCECQVLSSGTGDVRAKVYEATPGSYHNASASCMKTDNAISDTALENTVSNQSHVSFNKSVSVAMFHKNGQMPSSDTENELEEWEYYKKHRRHSPAYMENKKKATADRQEVKFDSDVEHIAHTDRDVRRTAASAESGFASGSSLTEGGFGSRAGSSVTGGGFGAGSSVTGGGFGAGSSVTGGGFGAGSSVTGDGFGAGSSVTGGGFGAGSSITGGGRSTQQAEDDLGTSVSGPLLDDLGSSEEYLIASRSSINPAYRELSSTETLDALALADDSSKSSCDTTEKLQESSSMSIDSQLACGMDPEPSGPQPRAAKLPAIVPCVVDSESPLGTVSEITGMVLKHKDQLDPKFICQVRELLSLPNLSERSRNKLNTLIVARAEREHETKEHAEQENEAEDGEWMNVDSHTMAGIVSDIVAELLRVQGVSGLHQLVDAVSRSSVAAGTSGSSFMTAATCGTDSEEYVQRVHDLDSSQTSIDSVTSSMHMVSPATSTLYPTLSLLLGKVHQRELEQAGIQSLPDLDLLSSMLCEHESQTSVDGYKDAAGVFVLQLVMVVVIHMLEDEAISELDLGHHARSWSSATNREDHTAETSAEHPQPHAMFTEDAQPVVQPQDILRQRYNDMYAEVKQEAESIMDSNARATDKEEDDGSQRLLLQTQDSVAVVGPRSLLKIQMKQKYDESQRIKDEEDAKQGTEDARESANEIDEENTIGPTPAPPSSQKSPRRDLIGGSLLPKPNLHTPGFVTGESTTPVSYPTCSKLLKKIVDRELQDDRAGVGSAVGVSLPTVSQLHAKIAHREQQLEAGGVGSVVNSEQGLADPTLSKLHAKVVHNELLDYWEGRSHTGDMEVIGQGQVKDSPMSQDGVYNVTQGPPAVHDPGLNNLICTDNKPTLISEQGPLTRPLTRPDTQTPDNNKPSTSINQSAVTNTSRFVSYPSADACTHGNQSLSAARGGATGPSSARGTVTSTPQTVLGSTKKTETSMSELRNFMVEKELIESKLRKLQMEVSGLQAENILLKDKNTRAQARCQYLEAELHTSRDEIQNQMDLHDNAISSSKRQDRDRYQRTINDLEAQVIKLKRSVEVCKAENAALQREIEGARRMLSIGKPPERSQITDSYKDEIKTLKDELSKSHDLLHQSEQHRKEESAKRKEASIQIIKLTEMKTLLQQQLENKSSTVAEKQLASLERRLRVTEERLHKERADRAAKLSDVEEKLMNENARLQVSEKELKRKLQREQDKNKTSLDKYRQTRDDNDRLQVALGEKPYFLDSISYKTKMASLRGPITAKKHADEIKVILERIRQEENIGEGEGHENEVIWVLWHQKQEVIKQLKQCELSLNLDPSGNLGETLKSLQHEHETLRLQAKKYDEAVNDLKQEKDNVQKTFQKEIRELVTEKHSAVARARDMEDSSAALRAENEALRSTLHSSGGAVQPKTVISSTWEAERESLQSKISVAEGDLKQSQRAQEGLDNQIQSLRSQLDTKQRALDNAMATVQHLEQTNNFGNEDEAMKQQKIDMLQAELQGYKKEVELWQEKSVVAGKQRSKAEEELDRLRQKYSHSPPGHVVAPGAREHESDKLGLESELHEKDNHILTLTVSYNEIENELMRCKQRHLQEEQRSSDLCDQLSELQTQLRHKARLMDQMGGTESEHQVELMSLRDNLTSANRQLTQCGHELKVKTVELDREKTKVHKLLEDLTAREQLLSQNIATLLQNGTVTSSLYPSSPRNTSDMLTQAEMRVRMVEYEQESITHDLERANAAIQSLVSENTDLVSQISVFRQELSSERAQVFQLGTTKADLEQKLHAVTDERDSAVRLRVTLEQDLMHQESCMRETISQLEEEAENTHAEYQQSYYDLDTEGKKMLVELNTNKRLVEARNKEIDVMRDVHFRQKQEVTSLQRRVAVLVEENQSCRSELDRVTKELTQKMREATVVMETNQSVSSQHATLQMEKYQLERDLEMARSDLKRYTAETTDLRAQLDTVSEQLKNTQLQSSEAQDNVVVLGTQVKSANERADTVVATHKDVADLTEKLTTIIEMTLSVASQANDKTSVQAEQISRSTLRDELNFALHQMDLIRQEIDLYSSTLHTERHALTSLKEQYQVGEEHKGRLEDKLKSQMIEMETLRSHLVDTRGTADLFKKEKQTLYQDVQEFCRKLSQKDVMIASLQQKNQHLIDSTQQEIQTEKALLVDERIQLEGEVSRIRTELADCQKQLQEKELQLTTYLKTSVDLQTETRAKVELEEKVAELKSELSQSSWLLMSQQTENTHLKDSLQQAKDETKRSHEEVLSIKEEMKEVKEEYNRETKVLRVSLTEHSQKHNMEKGSLQDNYHQVMADLRAAETSVVALKETKESLTSTNQQLEVTVQELKSQLQEETTAKRLMEHKAKILKSQLNETKDSKAGVDGVTAELQASVNKLETELSLEHQKYVKLKKELNSMNTSSMTQDQYCQSLQIQLAESQADKSSLHNQLETNKQNLNGKIRRLQLELKQQSDDNEQERIKLVQQSSQLSRDLEQTRELIATKNRDNLRLQEDNLSLEEKLREAQRLSRQATDGLKAEESSRETLERRVMELELLLAKLRNKDSDEASYETTRNEVTRMLSELTQRMQVQLGQQRDSESEARTKDYKRLEDVKKKLSLIESAFSQEQALHIVTKTQVKSLEDDNQRLRLQLQATRKRVVHSNEPDRTKTRLEEINEIIARSQTRAQQLLASGAYDDASRLSPIPDLHIRDLRSPIPDHTSPRVNLTPAFTSTPRPVNGTLDNTYLTKKH